MLVILLAACANHSLVGVTSCDSTAEAVDADDNSSLGYSADEVWAVLGVNPRFGLVWQDGADLGDETLELALTPSGTATVMSVTGQDCGYGMVSDSPAGETWNFISASADAIWTTSAGSVSGASGKVVIEAHSSAVDDVYFGLKTSAAGGWSSAAVESMESQVAESSTGACSDLSSGMGGAFASPTFSLSADCDTTGDGVPEFSGAWAVAHASFLAE